MNLNFLCYPPRFILMPFWILWILAMSSSKGFTKESLFQEDLMVNFTTTLTTATSNTPPYVILVANLEAHHTPKSNRIIDYHWQISTGEVFSGRQVTVKLTPSASYTITLTITDEDNHTANSRQMIEVHQTQKNSTCPNVDASCVDVSYTLDIMVTDGMGTILSQQTLQVQQHRQCYPSEFCVEANFEIGDISEMAFLNFVGLKPFYQTGEVINLDLVESFYPPHHPQKIDLWVAVETPDHDLYFLLDHPLQPFSLIPKPFKASIDPQTQYHLLDYTIPHGIMGVYKFYAFYNQAETNLSHLATTQRSHWAFAMTILGDHYK